MIVSINFRNPSAPAQTSKSVHEAMVADFIAKNGVRKFERGFSSDWTYLRNLFLRLGYDLKQEKNYYTIARVGSKGRPKRMKRDTALARIDEILISNGMQPFLRRAA